MKPIRLYFESVDDDGMLELLLGMEFDDFTRAFDIDDADAILLHFPGCYQAFEKYRYGNKLIIVTDLWNGYNNGGLDYKIVESECLKHCDRSRLLILTQYHLLPKINFTSKYTQVKKYDIMFNRHKAYFSQLPFKNLFLNRNVPWHWAGNRCYDIEQWTRASEHRSKIFLSANRPWTNRIWSIRPQLNEFLDRYAHLGYLAKHDPCSDNTQIKLYSRAEDPLVNGALEFEVRENQIVDRSAYYTPIGQRTSKGFAPVHTNYYENSFISIYGETVEYGNTVFVTEKTFNPLIQGHFILPFGARHLVKTIQDMGFSMPDFIDYSYDEIDDNQKRKDAFFKEIQRLLSNTVPWWAHQREKNLDLLFHNRRLFWHKSYDQFIPYVRELLDNTTQKEQSS
jgi:hypothetical protein